MKRFRFTLLVCSIIGLTTTYSFAQPATRASEKTMAHIRKFRTLYIKATMDNKPELLLPYYSESVRLMPAFQRTVIGKSNAGLYHKAFSNRFAIENLSRMEIEILDLGGQVLEIGKLDMKIVMKSSGKHYELEGTYLNVWQALDGDELAIITEAWNYNSYYGELHDHLKFEEVPSIYTALQPNVPVNNNISFELAALNRLLDKTVTHHDANVWSQYYANDAMLIPGYHPPRRGRKEIDEYIQMHVKELPIFEGLDIRNDRIDNLGTFVVEYASHIASWKNGDSSGVGTGKNIRIWRRESDHSLKLFRSMAMYD